MKVVAQRVQKASVYHEGVEVTAIGSGIVLYIGISKDEKEGGGEWLIDTIRGLLQPDDQVMCLSQFTLFATFKGPKPSFHKAERPAIASLYFDQLIKDIQNALECRVVRGPFGKQLEINLEDINQHRPGEELYGEALIPLPWLCNGLGLAEVSRDYLVVP